MDKMNERSLSKETSDTNLTLEDLLLRLRCPLSNKIFLKPVIASDGKVYEEDELLYYIDTGNVNESLINYKEIRPIESLISFILEKYPEFKSEQYKPNQRNSKYIFRKDIEKIRDDISKKKFETLLKYTGIIIGIIPLNYYTYVLDHATEDIIIHVLNNTLNINFNFNFDYDNCKWALLNRCMKDNHNHALLILKHTTKLNVNTFCEEDGWYVGHQAFYYGVNLEIIKLLISKGMKLNNKNKKGQSVFDACMLYSKYDVLEYMCSIISDWSEIDIENMINKICNNSKLEEHEMETIVNTLLDKK